MQNSSLISSVELFKLSIPLKEPFITSLGRDDYAKNVLVRIRTADGYTGYGECSPYMPINGESQDTCFIVGQYFARVLKGKNALDIATCIQLMDTVIYGNSSIKSAFDIALYDIAAQYAGLPLYQYLGGANNKTIYTDYTVSIGEPTKMAEDALMIKQQGFQAIKVKLGRDGKKDVERIRMIRETVGDEIPVRIDANQGWQVEEAIETLQALEPFGIQHCEEPIARWAFMRLPEVRRKSPIPIMADECCGNDHDAERLIALQACDMMNIKLGKSGGIFKAFRMVDMAAKANIHLQVGAMLESRLGMTAFAHFALCHPIIEHYDFDTALMFSEDPVEGGIHYAPDGRISITDTPGLGAAISESWLKKMEYILI